MTEHVTTTVETARPETRAEAWKRREALRGEVDFTMMYAAHDAFCRDLERLLAAADADAVMTPEARGTWELFRRMLHVHHTAEDVALWPPLEAAVTDPADVAILAAMEAEHAAIDPLLIAISVAYADHSTADIRRSLVRLSAGLRAHMIHEENDALPLLERTLGAQGWAAFGREMRSRIDMRQLPTMLTWLLDEAAPAALDGVLDTMPAVARVLYRRVWSNSYGRAQLLHEEVAT